MKRKLHFAVLAVDGSVTSSVYGPIELVQACGKLQANIPELDPCEISTEVLSPDGRPFLASSGYRMPVDGGLRTSLPPSSVIFFSGFGFPPPERLPAVLERHADVAAWLKQRHERGATIAATCTGNFLLAESGLLRRKATTHWLYAELFRQRYPRLDLDVDATVVEDERVFSVGGGVCGLDTAVLTVIERFLGREIARICTKLLVLESRRPSELRYEERQPAVRNDPMVDKAVDLIRRNLSTRVTVDDLLRQLPTSRRTLNRRFKLETGEGIQSFIQRLRIDRAKLLLETSSLPIEQIVDHVGYRDKSAFARQFKRHTQLTPQQYRRRYGSPRLA